MMRSRPSTFTADLIASSGVSAASTTSSTESTSDVSRCASDSMPIGGVSTITHSNVDPASSRTWRMRFDDSTLIGSGSGRPAVSTVRCSVTRMSGTLRGVSERTPSFKPPRFGSRKISCTHGRRRSASTRSTWRRYDSLNVSARLAALSVLPSPGSALVTMITRVRFSDCATCSRAARRRYCSTDCVLPERVISFSDSGRSGSGGSGSRSCTPVCASPAGSDAASAAPAAGTGIAPGRSEAATSRLISIGSLSSSVGNTRSAPSAGLCAGALGSGRNERARARASSILDILETPQRDIKTGRTAAGL
jgi:hypothetical protein